MFLLQYYKAHVIKILWHCIMIDKKLMEQKREIKNRLARYILVKMEARLIQSSEVDPYLHALLFLEEM